MPLLPASSTGDGSAAAAGPVVSDFERLVQESRRRVREELGRALHSFLVDGPLVVEFGCGHGHFLVDYARAHQEHRCLGVDFCSDRIRRALRKQGRAGLPNLQFVRAAADDVIAEFPAGVRCARVFVLFPDPWPKRRHWKNRLVSPGFFDRLAPLCEPGAGFYFRSDAADYAQAVRAALERHRNWQHAPHDTLPLEVDTVFQQKARRYDTVVARRSAQLEDEHKLEHEGSHDQQPCPGREEIAAVAGGDRIRII